MHPNQKFIEKLVLEIPEVAPLLDEHMKEYEELLAHVFMGDVTAYVLALHKASESDRSRKKILHQILQLLEEGFSHGDKEVQDLIGVSFLENLTGEEGRETLRNLLGPTMSEALKGWD